MITKELVDYIKKQIDKGVGNEDIKKILIQYKWAESDIDEAFNVINSPKKEPAQSKNYVSPAPQIQPQKTAQPVEATIKSSGQEGRPKTEPAVQASRHLQEPGQKPATTQQPVAVTKSEVKPLQPQAKPVQETRPVQQPAQPIQQAPRTERPAVQPQVKVQINEPAKQQPSVRDRIINEATIEKKLEEKPRIESKPETTDKQQPSVSLEAKKPLSSATPKIDEAKPQNQNFAGIAVTVIGLIILLGGGFFLFQSLSKQKPKDQKPPAQEQSKQPEQPTTTQPQVQQPPANKAVSPTDMESLDKELAAVLEFNKNKGAGLSEDQKKDMALSDKLVNVAFFIEFFKSKKAIYPDALEDLKALGNYKTLSGYGSDLYNFAYSSSQDGKSYIICAQYIKGYRCFASGSAFAAKAKTYFKNLK